MLDTSPDSTNCELVENVTAEVRTSVTHPAPAPIMCDCLTVLGGKCYPYLSTDHISTDDGNLPFLIEPVETIYLSLDFHCKTTLELNSGCYPQHLPRSKFKRRIGARFSSRTCGCDGRDECDRLREVRAPVLYDHAVSYEVVVMGNLSGVIRP